MSKPLSILSCQLSGNATAFPTKGAATLRIVMVLTLLNGDSMETLKQNYLRPTRYLTIRELAALLAVASGIYLFVVSAVMLSRSWY
jgi:hypothetical protein